DWASTRRQPRPARARRASDRSDASASRRPGRRRGCGRVAEAPRRARRRPRRAGGAGQFACAVVCHGPPGFWQTPPDVVFKSRTCYKTHMPAKPGPLLARRERQIMDALYKLGRATAAEIRVRLDGAPSDSTVRTQLRVLESKGHVRHEE